MLNPDIAKKLEKDSDWQYLEQHIVAEIDSLDSLEGIDFHDKESAAIEGRARALAKEKLLEILEPFGGSQESTTDNKKHTSEKTGVV